MNVLTRKDKVEFCFLYLTNFRFRLIFFSPQQRSEDQISNNSENTESRQTRTREPMTRLYTVAERAPSSQSPASDLSQALSQAVSQAEQINQITRAAATAAAEAATAVSDGNDPGAGPSGTSTGPDYSTILGTLK